MKVTVGQLTDIHVADFADLRWVDLLTKRGTGWVNYHHKRAREYEPRIVRAGAARLADDGVQLALVTGDLTNLGLRSELRAALSTLEPLRARGIRTAVIPGNHDYYTVACASGAFEDETRGWRDADATDGGDYPFVVRAGRVSCVCFNSAVPTAPIMAYGRVGGDQISRARRLCGRERDTGQALMFAIHHHPTRAPERPAEWSRALRGAGLLRCLAAEQGAQLIIHGHNHQEHARRLRDAPEVLVAGIASSTSNRRAPLTRRGQIGAYVFDEGKLERFGVSSWDGSDFGPWAWTRPDEVPVESAREASPADH